MEKLGLEGVFRIEEFADGIKIYNSGIDDATSKTERSSGVIDKAGQSINNAGKTAAGGISAASAAATALGTIAGHLATAGLSLIGQAVSGISSAMIGGNAEFERYQTQFGVLLGSSEAATQRLKELADFGAKTPFELPGVVVADKVLQAFGLHADNVKDRFGMTGDEIRTVAGDVAAGTGAAFEEISTYLGKFASGSTGESISRMQELGIVTRSQLKDMGLEFSKSGELTSPLDKSMTVLLKAMKEKFGGMMDAQSSTFEGMVSNLQDWLGQTGRELGKPIFDVLKTNLQGLLGFLGSDAVKGALSGLATTVAGGLQNAIGAVGPVINDVIGFVGKLGPEFKTMELQFGAGGFTRMFTVFEDMSGAFSDFLQVLGMGETQAIDVSQAFQKISESLSPLADVVTGIFDGFSQAVDGVFQGIQLGLSTGEILFNFFSEFGQVLGMGESQATTFASSFLGVFTNIQAIVGSTMGLMGAIIQTSLATIDSIVVEHGAAISANLSAAWVTVSMLVDSVVNSISSVIQVVFGTLSTFLAAHGEEIATFIGGAWEKISSIISTVVQIIQAIVVPIFDAIAGYVSANQEGLLGTIELVWGTVKLIIGTALTLIEGIVKTALALIKGDWSGAWETIKTMFINIWEGIKEWFSGVPSQMFTQGKNVIQGLVDGINAAADKVKQALLGIVQSAIDAIKKSLGIASPSKVFLGFGDNVVNAWALGITRGAGSVIDAMGGITTDLAAQMAGVSGSVLSMSVAASVGNTSIPYTLSGTDKLGSLLDLRASYGSVGGGVSDTGGNVPTDNNTAVNVYFGNREIEPALTEIVSDSLNTRRGGKHR